MNDCIMENEVWKDVEDYKGLYQVSDLGRVKSVDRTGGSGRRFKGKVLRPGSKNGYQSVVLCKQGKCKAFFVHRLVARAFIPNSYTELELDHIDCNKKNNRVDNLEWVTHRENVIRSWNKGKRENQRKLAVLCGRSRAKTVIQIDRSGNVLNVFKSLKEAELKTGITYNNISMCCNGKRETAGSYHWIFD